jgi:uncharacterized membrane protein YphA (DoxX/SURF4 family)
MGNLSNIGRIFYGIAIAEIGIQTIYQHDFPYILSLPEHFWMPGHVALAFVFGIIFVLAGACLIFKKKTRPVSLLFGGVLLLIFCFYCVPYEFLTSPNYMHLDDWENAEKELAFAGGAFVIAGCFPGRNENQLTRFLGKLIPLGAILFAITIVSFGILHFMEAKDASTLVPSWIPYHMFWIYFCGAALIGSGVAIILKIKTGLFAALLGLMIFLWFILLHIPRVIAAPAADMGGEITSACLALAYCGIAFVIAGLAIRKVSGLSN